MTAFALLSCSQSLEHVNPSESEDRAVIAVVLQDFALWKEATFGDLDGVLILDPMSYAGWVPQAPKINDVSEEVQNLLPHLSERVSNELAVAWIERNKVATPVAELIADSPWARIRTTKEEDVAHWQLPPGAKARGQLTLPGYSIGGSHALVTVHHSWSIHGAVITYVLSKNEGRWEIVARDQTVYL